MTLNRLLRGLLGLIVLAVVSTPAAAQTDHDEGLWLMFVGQGDFDAKEGPAQHLRWWVDIQPRWAADGTDQFLARPGLGYAFLDKASAWLGYAFVRTEREESGHVDENRIWQQLNWTPSAGDVDFLSRTRLEQRWLDSGDDTGWRARQFVKATYPLPSRPRLFLSGYDEVFFDLNDTDWGQDTGFAQNRLFAGIGWKFDPEGHVVGEFGYLNQFVERSGDDQMNHILSLNFFFNP